MTHFGVWILITKTDDSKLLVWFGFIPLLTERIQRDLGVKSCSIRTRLFKRHGFGSGGYFCWVGLFNCAMLKLKDIDIGLGIL